MFLYKYELRTVLIFEIALTLMTMLWRVTCCNVVYPIILHPTGGVLHLLERISTCIIIANCACWLHFYHSLSFPGRAWCLLMYILHELIIEDLNTSWSWHYFQVAGNSVDPGGAASLCDASRKCIHSHSNLLYTLNFQECSS